jgi:2,3-bisphosphoglycerate-dependent phosphoglycerate mutase
MQFYFVRHGESEANVLRVFSNRDLPHSLTPTGRQQAESLAAALAAQEVRRLYTSPIPRAIETVNILALRLGIPFTITEALREYDCGVLEGTGDEAGWALYDSVLQTWVEGNWEHRIEGGESMRDMEARFVPFIEELVRKYGEQPGALALVGHGGLYRCMLPLVLANIDFAFTMANGIDHSAYVLAEPGTSGLVCREWCGQVL